MTRTFLPHVITDDSALGGSVIQRSLRFNDDDTAYLTRTPSSASNRKTFTLSVWVKRTTFGTQHLIMNAHVSNGDQDQLLGFTSSDFPHVWMDGGTYGLVWSCCVHYMSDVGTKLGVVDTTQGDQLTKKFSFLINLLSTESI